MPFVRPFQNRPPGWPSVVVGATFLALVGGPGGALAQTTPMTSPTMSTTGSTMPSMMGTPAALPTAAPAAISPMPSLQNAADLRVALDGLLQEHTYLAGQAIDPLIAGQPTQAAAAASVLDANTQEIANLLGSLYGQQTQQTFLQLWKRHLTDYVQYAQAGMTGDMGTQQQTRQDLLQFAQDVDTLLSGVNPNLTPGMIASGMTMHVQGTLQVIDALEAKDYVTAYTLGKNGADMTGMLGDPLASAIAQQFPDQFPAGSVTAQDAGQ